MATETSIAGTLSGKRMVIYWLLCFTAVCLLVVAETKRTKVKVEFEDPYEEKECRYDFSHVATFCSAGAAFLIVVSHAVLLCSTKMAALVHPSLPIRSAFAVSWLLLVLLEVATIMLAIKNERRTEWAANIELGLHCFHLPPGLFISSGVAVVFYGAASTVYSILIARVSSDFAERGLLEMASQNLEVRSGTGASTQLRQQRCRCSVM